MKVTISNFGQLVGCTDHNVRASQGNATGATIHDLACADLSGLALRHSIAQVRT